MRTLASAGAIVFQSTRLREARRSYSQSLSLVHSLFQSTRLREARLEYSLAS